MRIIKKLIVTILLFITFTTIPIKAEEINIYINRWNIQLTADEIELISRIVQLECGYDTKESKYATIETIFNRILDPRYPNTLKEVLSQEGQFSTWKNRNIAEANPTNDTYECVLMVLSGQTNILEYDRLKFNNHPIGQKPIKIGKQYYGSQK